MTAATDRKQELSAISGRDIYDWAEEIRKNKPPDKKRLGLGRFVWHIIKEDVLEDLSYPLILSGLIVSVSWILLLVLDFRPAWSVTEILYMSIFQGFLTLIALVFGFVTVIYIRGEARVDDLLKWTGKRVEDLFVGIRVYDETEVRILLHLWGMAKSRLPNPTNEEILYRRITNVFGRGLIENRVMNSMPVRTLCILAGLGAVTIAALMSLASGITHGAWVAFMIWLSVFLICWLLWFTEKVLVEINCRSYPKAKDETVLAQSEKQAIASRFKLDLDKIEFLRIRPLINPDAEERKGV